MASRNSSKPSMPPTSWAPDPNVAGTVSVDNFASITAPAGTDGIRAYNYGIGSVTVTAEASSNIEAGGYGIDAHANDGGDVSISNLGTVDAATGIALYAETIGGNGSGTATVTNSGSVFGNGTSANPVVEIATVNGAATLINNDTGIIAPASSSASGLAISESGGAITINNYGAIIGDVDLANTTFTNENGGIWDTSGVNTFGTGTNSLTNEGTINVEANTGGITTTIGATLNNAGTVDVQGGVLDISGAVTGAGAFTIGTGATLKFNNSVASGTTVYFGASTGTLMLEQPSSFGGAISAGSGTFASGDVIYLAGFNATYTTATPTFNSSTDTTTLLVNDPHDGLSVSLTLDGNYSADTFTASSASGGADIADPPATGPTTSLHYAPNGNIVNGVYTPGSDGFNLADVSSVDALNSLTAGVKGLVWLGMGDGATASFQSIVSQYIGNPNLYGFYLVDEPDPSQVSAANLKAESDWIHAHVPGAITFIVLQNFGTPENPSYLNTYNPANTDIDLFGLDPYPVRPQFPGGADYSVIPAAVAAAEAAGIPLSQIVPIYQAFGQALPGNEGWTMPTASQEQQILATWASAVPAPQFDYAYSWGQQGGDSSLNSDPALQQVFAQDFALDTTAPTVSTIKAVTDNGATDVTAGHVITVTVSTSEPVTVTGTPTLQLNDNEVATYVSGSGSSALIFSYTVQPSDKTTDLKVTGLNLPNGASIEDQAGNSLAGSITADLGLEVNISGPPTINPLTVTQIDESYQTVLQRAPTNAEVTGSVSLDTTIGNAGVIAAIVDLAEAQANVYPIVQIIDLATGSLPTAAQLASWVPYVESAGLLQGQSQTNPLLDQMAEAFVASTQFGDTYNGGTAVNPNAPITASIVSAIIQAATGVSATQAQVNAWLSTGQTIDQVFVDFALGDQYSAHLQSTVQQYLTTTAETAAGGSGLGVASTITPNDGLTSTQVQGAYQAVLQRPPTAGETNAALSIDGSIGNVAALAAIVDSPEAQYNVYPIVQIIELATGSLPTAAQLAGWVPYVESAGLLQGQSQTNPLLDQMAEAFVASTTFGDTYNGGTAVDPNAPITASIVSAIIQAATGVAATQAQINGWVATGLSIDQVFVDFALGDQYTAATQSTVQDYLTAAAINRAGLSTVDGINATGALTLGTTADTADRQRPDGAGRLRQSDGGGERQRRHYHRAPHQHGRGHDHGQRQQ